MWLVVPPVGLGGAVPMGLLQLAAATLPVTERRVLWSTEKIEKENRSNTRYREAAEWVNAQWLTCYAPPTSWDV